MKKLIALLLTLASILGTFIITTSAASSNFDWDDVSSSNTISFYADEKVRTYTSKKLSSKSGSIYSGDLVKIIKVYDSVARVEYPTSNGTKKAYIALDALIESNSDKWDAFTATEKIKVYRADDLKKSFGSIYKGDECFVISSSSGVAQVLYPVSKGFKIGYVSTKVLASSTESIDIDSSGTMIYDVPHYQQSDKTWSNIILNPKASTKRTIGSHGCTTTAAAMICAWALDDETITPATIQKTASYTSDNLLEWNSLPIDVTLTTYNKTMSSSIRKDLVKLLEDGPVIIGAAKNSSGSRQHWCIVVAFTGDPDAPRNSDFIVFDPAKKTESTLNDFLQNRTYIKRLVYAK